jgi:hypothetical protein
VATAHGTYQGKTDTLSVTTDFDDYVFYTQWRQTIYYWPGVGPDHERKLNSGSIGGIEVSKRSHR